MMKISKKSAVFRNIVCERMSDDLTWCLSSESAAYEYRSRHAENKEIIRLFLKERYLCRVISPKADIIRLSLQWRWKHHDVYLKAKNAFSIFAKFNFIHICRRKPVLREANDRTAQWPGKNWSNSITIIEKIFPKLNMAKWHRGIYQ